MTAALSPDFASPAALAEIASLLGDPSRANILVALMDGRALTAGELGARAHVTAATASGHLAKLLAGRLVAVEAQGRHRYYRLARKDVAVLIENLMVVSIDGPARHRPTGPRDEAMRAARSCYDHLAGRLAVGIADALVQRGAVVLADGAALVTDDGRRFLCDFGIDLTSPGGSKRPLCRTCLDWSERRPHLAGTLGALLLDRLLALNWVARVPESRAIRVTPAGERGFSGCLRVAV
jgi:DNA-binding transcriptional ArsR family regulator